MPDATDKLTRRIPFLAAILYFSEGLPYGIVNELFPLYLRSRGVSLAAIGLISTISLAWTFKVLWSPLVDRMATYRSWISGALLVLTLCLITFALSPAPAGPMFWATLTILALASATQDIAVDAYTIVMTPTRMLGPVNSIRVASYRVAIILCGGGMAALASTIGWPAGFWAAAAITAGIFVFTRFLPDTAERVREARQPLFRGLLQWIARPNAVILLAVVLLYRLGDAALLPMIKPFWIDLGYSTAEVGTVTTVIGVAFTILGAFLGGLVIAKIGILRALLILGVVQMLSNAGYATVATWGLGRTALYTASIVENLTSGLGIAAFLAFLMAICDREFAATEFAMLSAIFALTRSVAGSFSGIWTESIGYPAYFWITTAMGIPGLLIIPFIRRESIARREEAQPAIEALSS